MGFSSPGDLPDPGIQDFPSGSDGKVSAMQETWVQSLGREDPLEKEIAIHSSTIA